MTFVLLIPFYRYYPFERIFHTMILQQVQNTTLLLHFAGKTLLIDPVLESLDSGMTKPESGCSSISAKEMMREILQADAVIVTSLHPEHFDEAALRLLPRSIPIFVQDRMDQETLKFSGFTNTTIMEKRALIANISLTRTPSSGNPCGVLIEHPAEKTLFVTGDSVWNDKFLQTVHTLEPRAIAVNCGVDTLERATPCTLDKKDFAILHNACPKATLITCNIEAFQQWGFTRETLEQFAAENNFTPRLFIPGNGQKYFL